FQLALGHGAAISGLAAPVTLAPDGRTLLARGATRLHLYDVNTGQEFTGTRGPEGRIHTLAFSPDGKSLATAGDPVSLWPLNTNQKPRLFARSAADTVWSVAYSPDGRYLVWAKSDTTLCLWDLTADREVHELTVPPGGTYRVAFSPDGKTLAA